MPIRVECPHCQSLSEAPGSLSGETANCPNCGQKLQVPIPEARIVSSDPRPPVAPTSVPTSPPIAPGMPPEFGVNRLAVRPTKKRRRSTVSALVRSLLYLASTVGAMYAGHFFVQKKLKSIEDAANARVAIQAPTPQPKILPRREWNNLRRKEPTPTPPILDQAPTVIPQQVAQPAAPLTPLPAFFALPKVDDQSITTLIAMPTQAILSLVTDKPGLALEGNRIKWSENDTKERVVAGLTYRNDTIQFRWVGEVSEEAENVIRNSLVQIGRSGQQPLVSLRSPERVEAFDFDLKKSVLRIVCKCEHMPAIDTIRFDFVDADKLPPFKLEGVPVHEMQVRQEATLRFSEATGVKTVIKMRKRGNTVIVEMRSLFMLPTGDVEALTISAGTRKHKKLSKLIASAESARSQLPSINARIAELRQELKRWQNMRTTRTLNGVQVPDTVASANKFASISNTENSIAFGVARLAKANRLIADLPAMQREIQALERISVVAKKLHQTTNLGFRFYRVCAGHEINLIVAESQAH